MEQLANTAVYIRWVRLISTQPLTFTDLPLNFMQKPCLHIETLEPMSSDLHSLEAVLKGVLADLTVLMWTHSQTLIYSLYIHVITGISRH